MPYKDPSSSKHVVGLQAEEEEGFQAGKEEGQATGRQLTRQASQTRPGGVAWHGRWLLCNLGYRLVALGAWLEGRGLSRNARRR
jgi:hypothetical protein